MFQIRRNDNTNHNIIEETRAKKERHFIKNERIQKMIPILNRYSLLFHVLLACGVCFAIEWISRHSFLSACSFVIDRNLVFLYNSLIVFASLMLVYTVKRRALLRTVISVLWLFLGTINGCILAKRVSPFSFTDIKMCCSGDCISRIPLVQRTEVPGEDPPSAWASGDCRCSDDDSECDGCGSQQQHPDQLF